MHGTSINQCSRWRVSGFLIGLTKRRVIYKINFYSGGDLSWDRSVGDARPTCLPRKLWPPQFEKEPAGVFGFTRIAEIPPARGCSAGADVECDSYRLSSRPNRCAAFRASCVGVSRLRRPGVWEYAAHLRRT